MKITMRPMTAEEAWELAKQVALTTNYVETARIFISEKICGIEQKALFEDVFALTPQEAKAKLEEWESKQIQVGDVITTINGCAEHLVLRVEHNPNRILHVCNIANGTVQTLTCEVKKTGKHIDISSILEQIKEKVYVSFHERNAGRCQEKPLCHSCL